MSDQLITRPVKSWASGLQDYLKHVEQIKDDFKDVLEAKNGASDGPTGAPGGFGAKSVGLAPPVPMFGGSAAAPAQESSLFASFAAPPAPAVGGCRICESS